MSKFQAKFYLSRDAVTALHEQVAITGRTQSAVIERLLLSDSTAADRLALTRSKLLSLCSRTTESPRSVLATALTIAAISDQLPWRDLTRTVNSRTTAAVSSAVDDIVKTLLG